MRPLSPSIQMVSLACLLGLAWTALARSSFGDRTRQSAIAPLEFKLRSLFKKTPELHPNIKIFGFDDKTRVEFGPQENLHISLWQKLITSIATRQPRAILIDKVFTDPIGSENELSAFTEAIQETKTPVNVAAIHSMANLRSASVEMVKTKKWEINRPTSPLLVEMEKIFIADRRIADAFTAFTSIQRTDAAYLKPALLVGLSASEVLPALGLSVAKTASYGAEELRIDSAIFSLDPNGRIPVNFTSPAETFSRTWPVRDVLQDGPAAKSISLISNEDVVFIIPSLYSGGTDFKDSPVGNIPGAFYQVSLLNSLLSDKTLTSVGQSWPVSLALHVLISLLMMFFLLRARPFAALLFISIASLTSFFLPGFLFIFTGIITDWPTYFSCIASATLLFGGHRIFEHQRWTDRIDFALTGLVEPKILKILKHTPDLLYKQARKANLTVMFIDIENFSTFSQNSSPEETYQTLTRQLRTMISLIHAHGGTVDKTLGDGLLCYFGSTFFIPNEQSRADPAEDALQALICAIAIQDTIAGAVLNPKENVRFLPVRIGLNSGECYFGNIGTTQRFDFTLVGNLVNTCKRLEEGCESFRIFLSESTYQTLSNERNRFANLGAKIFPKYVPLKHGGQLIKGWECFSHKQIEEQKTEIIRKKYLGKEIEPCNIVISGQFSGRILALDEKMCLVQSEAFIARKAFVEIRFASDDKFIHERLISEHLEVTTGFVGRGFAADKNNFLHEIELEPMPVKRLEVLAAILKWS